MKLTPVQVVIQAFGGVRKTAKALGKTPQCICMWQTPRGKGGTGGLVPAQVQQQILAIALERNLDISPAELVIGREISS